MRAIKILAIIFSLWLIPVVSFASDDEAMARKWIKTAEDTLGLAEKTVQELIQNGIERISEQNDAVKVEWQSAGQWLSLAKSKLEQARKLCSEKKWKDCENIANESWQYLVKAATAAINAGRAAGIK